MVWHSASFFFSVFRQISTQTNGLDYYYTGSTLKQMTMQQTNFLFSFFAEKLRLDNSQKNVKPCFL